MSEPNPAPPSRLLRFWRHPVTQLFARLLAFVLFVFLLRASLRWLVPLPQLKGVAQELADPAGMAWLRLLRMSIVIGAAYFLMVHLLERRPVTEFALRKAPMHLATGWLVGMGILVAAALALAAVGSYTVTGFNADAALLTPLAVLGFGAGISEEIIARGILFRIVEEPFGTWFALVFSALLFGFGHAANPNATWWSSLAIAIEAGLLLGMAYAWTRSMWFVISLHAAWNFTQGPLLGIPVSGIAVEGLLESTLDGPVILSGGEFGAEASILTVVLCVAAAIWFGRRALAAGRVVPPFWRRRRADGSVPALEFPEPAPK